MLVAILSLIVGIVVYQPISLPNRILGREWSDFYTVLSLMNEWASALEHGSLPIGIYWLHGLYGGGPAYYHFLPNLPTFALFILFRLVGDYFIALKTVLLITLVVAGIGAYRYASLLIGSKKAALVAMLTYLCAAFYVDLWQGHLHILVGVALLPLVAAQLEVMLRSPTLESAALMGATYLMLIASEPQITLLGTLLLIIPRATYHLIAGRRSGTRDKNYLRSLGRSAAIAASIAICGFPLILPYFVFYPITYNYEIIEDYANQPFLSFCPPSNQWFQYPYYYYLGVVPILFVCTSLIGNWRGDRVRDDLIFFLLILFICLTYASYAQLLSSVPVFNSIRVQSRANLIAALALSILCGISYKVVAKGSDGRKTLICAAMAALVLLDFTMLRPVKVTSDVYVPGAAYDYVKDNLARVEARIIICPRLWWSISNYLAAYVGGDSIGASPIGLPVYPGGGYPPDRNARSASIPGYNSKLLSVWWNLLEDRNVRTFPSETTLYGVRYIIIARGVGLEISEFLENAGFERVFEDEQTFVYENPDWRGLVFTIRGSLNDSASLDSLPNTDADVSYEWTDYNTISVQIRTREPCTLVISYVYHDLWTAKVDGQNAEITEFHGVMALGLNEGKHEVYFHFTAYEKSLPFFILMYVVFGTVALWLVIDRIGRIKTVKT